MEEVVVGGPVAVDKRVTNEHIASRSLIHIVVGHRTVRHDGDAVQRRTLRRYRGTAFARPRRIRIVVLKQVFCQLFYPSRVDCSDITRPQPGGLH